MPEDISLFDGSPVVTPPPRARRRDPATSKGAAARVVEFEGSHYDQIIAAMRRHSELGAEQIAAYTGIDPYQVRKRLPELRARGLVTLALGKDGQPRDRETVTGRFERLWRLTDAGA